MTNAADKASPKKPKLVRDSFTIPKNEFAAIDGLKTRAIALGTSIKKSELLRAGLMALQGLSDAAYKAALSAVPALKTGRPAADKPVAPAKKKAAAPVKKAAAKPAKAAKAVKAAPAKTATKTAAKPAAKAPARPAAKKRAPARKAAAKPAVKAAAKAA